MLRAQLTGTASDPGQHGQRRRCVRIAGLSSSQERDFPLLAECGLWCRERDEVSGVVKKESRWFPDFDVLQSLRVQYGLETYRYLSAGNFSNITPRWWLGAMHSCMLQPARLLVRLVH